MVKTQPITNKPQPTFGIYKSTIPKHYGYIIRGTYKGNSIDIHNAFDEKGLLRHKLYYIKNSAGNWIKSKLKYYINGKYISQVGTERDARIN